MARKISVEIVGNAASLERSFNRAGASGKRFERDIGRFGRGGVAASGAFRGLGRSIAFASASFIGGVGIVSVLKSSVNAAKDAQVAQAQLRTQFKASGLSYKANRAEITKTINAQGELSGFLNDDLTKSFTGFVRRTGNVNQALKLNAVATDIARAKGKDLLSVQQLLVRALAGNARAATSLGLPVVTVTKNMDALRASGVKATAQQTAAAKAADKLATGQAVIASAQKRFGGQAAAFGKTAPGAQERFKRSLHETEITIGNALLPSLKKLFQKLASYLNRLNRTGQLQRIAAKTVHVLGVAFKVATALFHGFVAIVHVANSVTGSFKNTLKLVAGAFVAFKVVKASSGLMRGFSATFPRAAARIKLFRSALIGKAGLIGALALVAIAAEIAAKKIAGLQKTQIAAKTRTLGTGRTQQALVPGLAAQIKNFRAKGVSNKDILAHLRAQLGGSLIADDLITEAFRFSNKPSTSPRKAVDAQLKALQVTANVTATKTKKVVADIVKKTAPGLTSAQKGQLVAKRNALFDAIIDARTNRAQNLPLGQQITALSKIAAQLTARIRITKDITRKLKLEQELFDIRGQRRDAQKQLAQNLIDARTSRQFRELGLTATGDQITPGVANLKKRLGSVSKAIQGTFLDTNKTKGVLARIRKVLSEGLVPKDVRAKLKEMLDGLTDELKNHQQSQQTKFRHVSTTAVLSGLGLSPEQFRKAQARLAQLGAGNTLPGQGSAAFAGAGAGTTTVNTTVNLDGKTVAKNTTQHQRKIKKRRTPSRRGPYAGHD